MLGSRMSMALLALPGCQLAFPLEDVTPPGLLAHYRMDDLAGEGARDRIAGHDAVCAGSTCPSPIDDGIRGGALHFDGADDFLLIDAEPFALRESFTIALWARIEATPGFRGLITLAFPGASDFDAWGVFADDISVRHAIAFDTTHGSETALMDQLAVGGTLIPGQWNHVACRWDAETGTKSILIDGVPSGSFMVSPRIVDPDASVVIGGDRNQSIINLLYTGDLDDVRIYDRPLDDLELLGLIQEP